MNDSEKNAERKYSLLVVDDDDAVRLAIVNWMTRAGFAVDEVSRGEDAVRAVSNKHYDAITMDVEMPGMSGAEATRRIRQINADATIVVLSGFRFDPVDLKEIGANLVLSKPISMAKLEAAIRSFL